MADQGPLGVYGEEAVSTDRPVEGPVRLQPQFALERWDGNEMNADENALDSFASEAEAPRPVMFEPAPLTEPAPPQLTVPIASDAAAPAQADWDRSARLEPRWALDFTAGANAPLRLGDVTSAREAWRWMLAQPAVLVVALMAFAALGAGIYAAVATRPSPDRPSASAPVAPAESGSATITSNPPDASVTINGVLHGKTPLKVELPIGQHALELRLGATTRSIPLTVEPGVTVAQFADLGPAVPSPAPRPSAAAPATRPGRLEITSDPAGASVRVDGALRGNTPLLLTDLPDRDYRVVVGSGDEAITRRVRVAAGATASVVVTIREPAALAGWVSIAAPFELQIFEAGQLIGTTAAERLMLPVGTHRLELVNESIAFRTTLAAEVIADKTATVPVPVPDGRLSVNALPWAEVFLDGRSLGTTPLANLPVPIGLHEIVWRHPQLGERKQTITVTTRAPERVGVDLTK